jgi:hypothetical protein
MSKIIDLTGRQFERLIVLKRVGNKNGRTCWSCQCVCGNKKDIVGIHLTQGRVRSCGCLEIENRIKHGLSHTRIYKTYKIMIDRCFNKNNIAYERYGGRGITVCNEWLEENNGLVNFYDWAISNGYSDKLTIDRKDSNDNYSPSNCEWSNYEKQNNNRRNNVYIEINGYSKTVPEWGREYNISPQTIRSRIRKGVVGEALLLPSRPKKNKGEF